MFDLCGRCTQVGKVPNFTVSNTSGLLHPEFRQEGKKIGVFNRFYKAAYLAVTAGNEIGTFVMDNARTHHRRAHQAV